MFRSGIGISNLPRSTVVRPHRFLQCPHCGEFLQSWFTGEKGNICEYDVLSCRCGSNPVIAGIPVFHGSDSRFERSIDEKCIALIKQGRNDKALLNMLASSLPLLAHTWVNSLPSLRSAKRLKKIAQRWALRRWGKKLAECHSAWEFLDLYFHRSNLEWGRDAYDYFAFRFGQPRHLVALSFTSLIHEPNGPILDLCCGCGHLTRNLGFRSNGQRVVGVDNSFFALFVAKNWIAPDTDYVCCTANAPLPFPDQVFSTVFCADGFHYVKEKERSIREIKRVMESEGIIILSVLRNARAQYPAAGYHLPPEDYRALVADMANCIVVDRDVLHRYLQKKGPDLERPTVLKQVSGEPLLSLVASQREEIFREYGTFDDWPHAEGFLQFNPLYAFVHNHLGEALNMKLQFPSAWYEQDNELCKLYLPETVQISLEALIDISRGKRTPEIENLISKCVLLGMPNRYMSDKIRKNLVKIFKDQGMARQKVDFWEPIISPKRI